MARVKDRPTWLSSERFLARTVARPVARFLAIEASGGLLLVAATVVALVWANSPWQDSYETVWGTELALGLGDDVVVLDLRHWVNDGLMALFFFVVGLEIKQELVTGQLSTRREAMLPAVAALGGMVVPALLYTAVNAGGDGASGWGVPMATDIAFALGVLALLGDRIPHSLKVLLLALAIVDDIGAIAVIAVFYSDDVHGGWALLAVGGLAATWLLRQARVWWVPVYAVVGVATWFFTLESGIHATIAGVALGLLVPARPLVPGVDADRVADELSADRHVSAADVRDIWFRIREVVPMTERLQDLLHPWTSYLVVPVFALANAGVVLSSDLVGDAVSSPVTLGVVVGLVVGKVVGVAGATALAVRFGVARLPADLRPRHILGMAALAGIGFTVSIFIAGLAFDDASQAAEAKLGILVASIAAAVLGVAVLRGPRTRADAPPPPG